MKEKWQTKCFHCEIDFELINIGSGKKTDLENYNKSSEELNNSNYGQCPECGTIYCLNRESVKYEDNYFEEEYLNQYGLTYKEDKINISKLNRERIDWLNKYLSQKDFSRYKVLDIGCAMGYFLEELFKEGVSSLDGVEISQYAIKNSVIKKEIRYYDQPFFDFYQTNNQNADMKNEYNLISSFYVLEHFRMQKEFFKAIYNLLVPGGYFYFAIPSINGPSFLSHTEKWIKDHPRDHFIDYSPKSLHHIMPKYGFKILGFRIPSYHINRGGGFLYYLRFLGKFGLWIYKKYCNTILFGDTIECLVQKS